MRPRAAANRRKRARLYHPYRLPIPRQSRDNKAARAARVLRRSEMRVGFRGYRVANPVLEQNPTDRSGLARQLQAAVVARQEVVRRRLERKGDRSVARSAEKRGQAPRAVVCDRRRP
jgi:hypothetical protein